MATRFKQFVVRDIGEDHHEVPVDNFVWKDDYLGLEVTLCTHASKVYVTTNEGRPALECPDIVTGLLRMAEVLTRCYAGQEVKAGTTEEEVT